MLFFVAGTGLAQAQNVDLVVNIVADQPAYMSQDPQHYEVTISNNGPDAASNVVLVVDLPIADAPFEASATCQALPGANPNGSAVCPPGSGTAPSSAFVRSGETFSVTLPSIPSQSQALIAFDNVASCIAEGQSGSAESCNTLPVGNFVATAAVSSDQNEVDEQTNESRTNVFLFPPDIQYKIEIVSAPASAVPGEIVEYEFEVSSFGLHPSDLLRLSARITGEAGDMTPMDWINNPYGPLASTLPGTVLQSLECVSMSLGGFDPGDVFLPPPAPLQGCPSGGLPIPTPTSVINSSPITGFPHEFIIANIPGTQDGPGTGGVMRFRATVEVGEPVCVIQPEVGYRELDFTVNVFGLFGTDTVPPGSGDNMDSVTTQVHANCEVADIELISASSDDVIALDANGNADWTHIVTVSNLSTGAGAGTATNVPVNFSHFSKAFTETRSPVTCTSTVPGLCPSAAELAAAATVDSDTAYQADFTIDSIPPGESLTFEQDVTVTRTECWGSTQALIDHRGHAYPSPAVFDPLYSTLPQPPVNFQVSGPNLYFANNGMQNIVRVNDLTSCAGGGDQDLVEVLVEKSGPYATAADAASNGPLIGQTAPTAVSDGTEVFFRIDVINPSSASPVEVGRLADDSFVLTDPGPDDSGFVHTGPMLSDWGISCTPSPATAQCHELVSTSIADAYTRVFNMTYDPTQHGGNDMVALPPSGTLSYVVPFVVPERMNRCHGPDVVDNGVSIDFVDSSGLEASTQRTSVQYYVDGDDCVPGTLDIQKEILAPADSSFVPMSGEVSFRLVLSNLSATETLDVAHLTDTPQLSGADLVVDSITCTVLSGGAQCPPTPIVPGLRTPASGAPTPLPNPYDIDHEWGAAGDNTFPPNSSLEVIVNYRLTNPTRWFTCLFNNARFSGENDVHGWVPSSDSSQTCPPKAPELSVQKTVSPQIAAPGSTVSYTLVITNIGATPADGTVLVDPLPPALLADNPSGYANVTCTDISSSAYIPNPQGSATCPPITSDASGLSAVIASFGPNSALEITYEAVMPDDPNVPVSVDNIATVTAPGSNGLSFGSSTALSHQNVQVVSAAPVSTTDPLKVPATDRWALACLLGGFFLLGAWRFGVLRN